MATTRMLHDTQDEALDALRDRAEELLPVARDPSDAIGEASDGTLRTLPDNTDHVAPSAMTAAVGWSDCDLSDPCSAQHLRHALEVFVRRLELTLGLDRKSRRELP